MTAIRRMPQWVPWALALLALTVLALLDGREEPVAASSAAAQMSHD